MTHWIYTTLRPDWLLEVDDAEHADLAAQRLILAEINPGTGEVIGGDLYVPPAPHVGAETSRAALDAAETLAHDQAADEADSSGG